MQIRAPNRVEGKRKTHSEATFLLEWMTTLSLSKVSTRPTSKNLECPCIVGSTYVPMYQNRQWDTFTACFLKPLLVESRPGPSFSSREFSQNQAAGAGAGTTVVWLGF